MSVITDRWRSRNLVGDAQHALIVRVRPGYVNRSYTSSVRLDTGSPIFPPLIWKGRNHDCWQGEWVPTGPWIVVPNVQSAGWTRDFTSNGSATHTLVMDNIAFTEQTGIAGVFHDIERGYFSPMRGAQASSRPSLWAANSWKDVLNGGYQLETWEGYGQGSEIALRGTLVDGSYAPASGALKRTFTGIVDECDSESDPDVITITSRDFGVLFTDERLMGNNKAPEVRSPVTFADRRRTQGEHKLTGPLTVSSGTVSDGAWRSAPQGSPSGEQWIELTLPKGFYTDFFVAPKFDGMEMWVSLHLNGTGTMDRTIALPSGWVDLGSGTVPGAGEPWIRHWGTVDATPVRRWFLGHGFDVPDGSRLRLTFSNLGKVDGSWYAGTYEMAAYQYGWDPLHPPDGAPPVNAKGWILVDDAAEVVRMILIWAGFKEWHIENFGWTLQAPMVFGEDKFYIDAISEVLAQGNYAFYMQSPTDNDMSIGVPHFQPQRALQRPMPGTLEVRDTDMLEAMQPKWDLSDLPYVIRYRGAVSKSGQTLGQDLVRRYMATYYPPWAGTRYMPLGPNTFRSSLSLRRTAGILRHFTQTLGNGSTAGLGSTDECLYACVLAAIQYALAMVTGQFQMPGLPAIELNTVISLVEESTGVNSRMWLASVASDHQLGPNGAWHMTLGGSLVDTQEIAALEADLSYAAALNQRHKAGL